MLLNLLSALAGGTADPALVITEIALILTIVLFSLSAHEAAHAYAAKRLGDYTAYYAGRVTLNPLKHLNPVGFLSMLLVGIGWANPVPINTRNFRNPRKGMMISSLAGPLMNLFIALIATVCSVVCGMLLNPFVFLFGTPAQTDYIIYACYMFFYYMAYLNFSLSIFNLIPCPPFDGSRIFFYFLPKDWYFKVMRYEQYLGLGILLIIFALSRIGYNPVSFLADGLYSLIADPLYQLFALLPWF